MVDMKHLAVVARAPIAAMKPTVRALLERGDITTADVAHLRCNSAEWAALTMRMTDDAFLERLAYAEKNAGRHLPVSTYDDALIAEYLPELVRRFQALRLAFLGETIAIDRVTQGLDKAGADFLQKSSTVAHAALDVMMREDPKTSDGDKPPADTDTDTHDTQANR